MHRQCAHAAERPRGMDFACTPDPVTRRSDAPNSARHADAVVEHRARAGDHCLAGRGARGQRAFRPLRGHRDRAQRAGAGAVRARGDPARRAAAVACTLPGDRLERHFRRLAGLRARRGAVRGHHPRDRRRWPAPRCWPSTSSSHAMACAASAWSRPTWTRCSRPSSPTTRRAGFECVAERHLGLQDNFSFSEVERRRLAGDGARGGRRAAAGASSSCAPTCAARRWCRRWRPSWASPSSTASRPWCGSRCAWPASTRAASTLGPAVPGDTDAMSFDLVIRNADVATASDRYRADIGITRRAHRRPSATGWPPARARSTPAAAWSPRAASTRTATSTSP